MCVNLHGQRRTNQTKCMYNDYKVYVSSIQARTAHEAGHVLQTTNSPKTRVWDGEKSCSSDGCDIDSVGTALAMCLSSGRVDVKVEMNVITPECLGKVH